MEIIETRTPRPGDKLGVLRAAVAAPVPFHTSLAVIAVGGALHHGARAMLVKPAEQPDKFLLPAIAPKTQPVRFRRMDPKFAALARLYPFWPHITQDTVREQAKLIGFAFTGLDSDAF